MIPRVLKVKKLPKVIETCTGQKQRPKVVLGNNCSKTLRIVPRKKTSMEYIFGHVAEYKTARLRKLHPLVDILLQILPKV